MTAQKILIVDDEPDITELVSYNLKKAGYAVASASDGEEALARVREDRFDLIVLDLMLPGIHGMELCRILRNNEKTAQIPIIMLTAKGEETDKIRGLETGADDYMTKPFSPKELIARVKAILRRSGERTSMEKTITLGDLVINLETFTVLKRGVPLSLSATEFKLFLYLIQHRGRVFSRDQPSMPYGRTRPSSSQGPLTSTSGGCAPRLKTILRVPSMSGRGEESATMLNHNFIDKPTVDIPYGRNNQATFLMYILLRNLFARKRLLLNMRYKKDR